MDKETKYNIEMQELRKAAEERLGKKIDRIRDDSKDDLEKVLQELSVYQIELEMQNEEIQRASVELETSRTKYADLYDFAPIGYFTLSNRGIIIEANLTGCQMLGVERNFLINKPFRLYVDNKSQDTYYLHRKASLIPNSKQTCEISLVRADKEQFEARLDSIAVLDSDDRVTGCRTSVIDITEKKSTERQIIDLAKFPSEDPFPVLRISEEGTIMYSNTPGKALLEVCNCKTGEKVTQDWHKSVLEALKTNKYFVKEVQCAEKIFSITLAPVSEGRYVNLYGRDITKKKQAQHALAQSEKKYRRLFNTMSEGFALHEIICDKNRKPCDYRFIEVNLAFEELTGLKAKDIEGKTVREVIPDIEQFWIDEYGEVAITGRSRNFESFSKPLGKYFEVFAFRPSQKQFAAIFTDITERKKDEEAIRIANERLELAQQGAGAGWWDWEIQTGKLLWSPDLFGLFGMDSSKDEATFDSWRSVIHPDDRKDSEDRIEEAIKNHTQLTNEYRIVIPDGKIRWINALGNTTYDEQGKAIRMSGICFDITERKRAEELLRYHAGLVDNIADAVISTDRKLNILSWNKAAEQMYGWKAEEVIGKSLKQFIKPEFMDNTKRADVLREVFQNGSWKGEVLQQKKDESKFYVSASMTVINNASGENLGFIAVDRDITERKKAEEALRESEERFRRAIVDAPIPIIMHAEDGEVLELSRTWTELTGYKKEDIRSFDEWVTNAVYGQGAEEVRDYLKSHFNNSDSSRRRDFVVLTKAGEQRYWSFSASSPGALKDGRRFIVGMALDITDRKKVEENLRLSEQRFRLALRNAPVSVSAQDSELRYIWAYNQKSVRPEEIIGHFDEDIFTPEEAAHLRDIKQRVLIEGSEFSEQMWFDRPNGRMFLYITWEPIFDKDGNITGVASSTVDMTPLKLAEDELRQKNEDLTRFNKYAVGRELRMIELKKEINSLCEVIGQPPRYKVDIDQQDENEKSVPGKS